jgi:hypothetical protein
MLAQIMKPEVTQAGRLQGRLRVANRDESGLIGVPACEEKTSSSEMLVLPRPGRRQEALITQFDQRRPRLSRQIPRRDFLFLVVVNAPMW